MAERKTKRRYLKLAMPIGGGLRLRIVERPALSLSAQACAQMLQDLRAVARSVLPEGDLTYGVLSGDEDRLRNAVVTLIYRDKVPVAFNALSIMPLSLGGQTVKVFHLGLVMVDPKSRGRGLTEMLYGLTCILLFLRGQCRPLRVSNVTQVPAVFGMVAETFDQVFPTPEYAAGPKFEHRTLARQIMAAHRYVFGVGAEAGFDEQRFVITNAYTGGSDDLKKTFDQAAKHRRPIYNAICERELDYARGDDFLQIGQLNMEAARRYLSRVVPPRTAPWLAGQLVIFAVQSAIAPLLHWFSDDQQWGVLRPWRSVGP